MISTNPVYRVGAATVTRIDELRLTGFTPAKLFPGTSPACWERYVDRLGPGSLARDTGSLVLSTHAWLVRTPHQTVLIDTAIGNDKERPDAPMFHHLHEPFLARLEAAGVRPQDVDVVLTTHLHGDHVGWNTGLRDGAWTPVFPRAHHIFSAKEDAYQAALDRGEAPDPAAFNPGLGPMARRPATGAYADSVRPVIEAGLAECIVVDGHEVIPGFAFLPTPGHSIDHASIRLRSEGAEALFTGDLFHHPLQVCAPALSSVFCEFPEAARRSRLQVLEEAASGDVLIFTAHCVETSAGRVTRDGVGYAWTFV